MIEIANRDCKNNQQLTDFQGNLKSCSDDLKGLQANVKGVGVNRNSFQGEFERLKNDNQGNSLETLLIQVRDEIQSAEALFIKVDKVADDLDSLTEQFIEITKQIQDIKSEKINSASE
jgi:archaellum component FlaC